MVTDEVDYVLGVDTHLDEHVLAVLASPAGAVDAKRAVPANARGYREALCLAERYAPGARAWAIEGAGHYGAGLARYLSERGEAVLEISRTPRAERRLRGKDDPLDAVRTARTALASETLTLPHSGDIPDHWPRASLTAWLFDRVRDGAGAPSPVARRRAAMHTTEVLSASSRPSLSSIWPRPRAAAIVEA